MSGHRSKWDNTTHVVPLTFLNAELVNHIGFPFNSSPAKKCATSLNSHACSAA